MGGRLQALDNVRSRTLLENLIQDRLDLNDLGLQPGRFVVSGVLACVNRREGEERLARVVVALPTTLGISR